MSLICIHFHFFEENDIAVRHGYSEVCFRAFGPASDDGHIFVSGSTTELGKFSLGKALPLRMIENPSWKNICTYEARVLLPRGFNKFSYSIIKVIDGKIKARGSLKIGDTMIDRPMAYTEYSLQSGSHI